MVALQDLPFYAKGEFLGVQQEEADFSLDERGGALFTLEILEAGSKSSMSVSYHLEVRPVAFRLPWLPRRSWPDLTYAERRHLGPEEGIEAEHGEIVALARKAVGDHRDPIFQAKLLYAAANKALVYDAGAGRTSALESLRLGRASCEGYARLYTALCRALDLPARLVYGLRLEPRELGQGEFLADGTRHMWSEVYLAGLGWAPVDPTFTYLVNGKREITNDYFARLDWDDLHIILGYTDPKVTWTYRVPHGHRGLQVEHHVYLWPL